MRLEQEKSVTLTTQAYSGATRPASYVWISWHRRVVKPGVMAKRVERNMESASAVSLWKKSFPCLASSRHSQFGG